MRINQLALEQINKNQKLDAYVKSVASKVSDYVSTGTMVFFPEYTDHNLSHFESVLDTAIDLATEESLGVMTDMDHAVLVTAIILHDLGMHISKDGFETLIARGGPLAPIEGFQDIPWNELWANFLSEAKKFDDKKLENLFGPRYRPVTNFPAFDEPWNEFDFLLVGEFLRRHHPRLAHEIAVYGMPSKDGQVINLCATGSEAENFLSDISGVVARSHGISLRETFNYLEEKYSSKIEVRASHPIYLMVLLRVSDFLQIQAERAPKARTDVVKFKSPVSDCEWTVHQCVTDITRLADPEAIDITAKPGEIETYLRLKGWLNGLQQELDVSWAVLGEVYGLQSHSRLNKLALKIRRIRSNVDDAVSFGKTVDYLPEEICFTVSDSELLKLLVGPLYSYDISIGLRELVQNAIDAVKEIDSIRGREPLNTAEERPDLLSDVEVRIKTSVSDQSSSQGDHLLVEVVDRGVGMTADTLKNFFLRAGSTFRKSSEWRNNFEKIDGTTRVQRSGRFGVGVLAAFLLGDKIQVETRHHSASREDGLSFSATIDESAISVRRHNCDVGTKILIEVSGQRKRELLDLIPGLESTEVSIRTPIARYFGKYPVLSYSVNGCALQQVDRYMLPLSGEEDDGVWRYFELEDLEVHWTYERDVIGLSVNQIAVSPKDGDDRGSASSAGVQLGSDIFAVPALSIGDNSGNFPLSLQRDRFAAPAVPFREKLLQEITDELIIHCLFHIEKFGNFRFPSYEGLAARAFHRKKIDEPYWFWCKDGMILNEGWFLGAYEPDLFVNRFGGVLKPEYYEGPQPVDSLRQSLERLTDRWIYSADRAGYLHQLHRTTQRISPGTFVHRKLMANAMRGEDFNFLGEISSGSAVFISEEVAELTRGKRKKTKTSRLIKRELQDFHLDALSGWQVRSGSCLSEPYHLTEWRRSVDVFGSSPCVVSLHSISNTCSLIGGDVDRVVFDRWMDVVGRPYFPIKKDELDEVRVQIHKKLGEKLWRWDKNRGPRVHA